MSDPLALGALGALALGEGIKFLYDQARTVLQRWREKRDRDVVEISASASPVLDAPLSGVVVAESVVAAHAEALGRLRRHLIEYAEEGRAPDPADADLLEAVDTLRRVLEVILGQRITFSGERRDMTGTVVDVAVEAQLVEGYLAGLRSRGDLGEVASINSTMRVDTITTGGEAVGIDLDHRTD